MRLAEPSRQDRGFSRFPDDLGWDDFDGSNLEAVGRRGDQGPVSPEEGAYHPPGTLGGLAVRP